MNQDRYCVPAMNPVRKVRAVAIVLILVFSLGVVVAASALVTRQASPLFLLGLVINLAFVVAGAGLLRLKRWSWWLTIGLCGISVIQLLWQLFRTLTPETATKPAEIASYAVAGFYLAVAFFLT